MRHGQTALDQAVGASAMSTGLLSAMTILLLGFVIAHGWAPPPLTYVVGAFMLWSLGAAMGQLAAYRRARRLTGGGRP